MYDEVMQLIALAKNDEVYFKRIEDLKQQMLELAQVKEIAKTLGEADLHLAGARQKAEEIIDKANKDALEIKDTAQAYVTEQKDLLAKTKAKKTAIDKKEEDLDALIKANKDKHSEMETAIAEHRKLTADRTEETEKAKKIRIEFENKMRQLKEIANA